MVDGMPNSAAPGRAVAPAPGRECGECSLCCKVPLIVPLDKPAGRWCRHCTPGHGCGIWPTRPAVCRSFHCLWITDPRLGPEWKPSRAHFMIGFDGRSGNMSVQVDEDDPDAWKAEPYHEQLRDWSLQLMQTFRLVLVLVGRTTTVVTSTGDVELGVMGPDDRVSLEVKMTPGGPCYVVSRGGGGAGP